VRASQLEFRSDQLRRLCLTLSSIDRRLELIEHTCETGIMPPPHWIYELNWKIEQVIRMIAGFVPLDVQSKVERELKAMRDTVIRVFRDVTEKKAEDRRDALLWSLNEYHRFVNGFLTAWLAEVQRISERQELETAIEILLRMLRVERVPTKKGERVVVEEAEETD